MGTSSIIRPGEVQRMSAGTGVTHSEFNASTEELVHFFQIWILPARPGGKPGYEQKTFPAAERRGKWRLVASPDGRDGSVTIHQDVGLYTSLPQAGETLHHELAAGRHAWLHVARGEIDLAGEKLAAGDAAAISDARGVELTARDVSEVLLFDLA
jgi:redox-sensitive bicupin YhaK (pirin superfamily)